MKRAWVMLVAGVVALAFLWGVALARKTYVGSKACADCHEDEYNTFIKYSPKVHSFESVMKLKKDLSAEEFTSCLKCHTTGYGQPGGFKSVEKTPQLKEVGCEVCHGPGSKHCESEDPSDISMASSFRQCEVCHTKAISEEFDFKPLLHGGAH